MSEKTAVRPGNIWRQLWGASAAGYAELSSKLPVYVVSNQRLIEAVGVTPGDAVLDLACGTGATLHAAFMAEPGIREAWAVDWSREMIDQARQRLSGRPVSYVVASAHDFGARVGRGSVDRAICNAAFFQFVQPLRVLDQLAWVLRSGGRLGFTLPGPANTTHHDRLFERLGLAKPTRSPSAVRSAIDASTGIPRHVTAASVETVLDRASWSLETLERVDVQYDRDDFVRWLTLPVFRRREWFHRDRDELFAQLRAALDQTDVEPTISWLIVVARPCRARD